LTLPWPALLGNIHLRWSLGFLLFPRFELENRLLLSLPQDDPIVQYLIDHHIVNIITGPIGILLTALSTLPDNCDAVPVPGNDDSEQDVFP